MCYNKVLDYTAVLGYCTAMVLHTIVNDYIVVSLGTVVHYIVVVMQIVVWDCTMVVAQCYNVAATHIVMLHVQLEPCMYLQYFLSSSPRFCNLCLRVQLTYKSYKKCSLVLSDISASGGNDRDHAHVFFKSCAMVFLKLKGLAYPLQYTVKIMDTHSCDELLSYTLYTKCHLFSPFLCSGSTRMLSSSDLASTLPQLDMYVCTSFPLTIRLPAGPHPRFGIFVVSKDTSSVETKN
jgi:hypothetical protein